MFKQALFQLVYVYDSDAAVRTCIDEFLEAVHFQEDPSKMALVDNETLEDTHVLMVGIRSAVFLWVRGTSSSQSDYFSSIFLV